MFDDATAFRSAAGNPDTVIDFESLGDGTPVTGDPVTVQGDEWAALGVTFLPLTPSTGLTLRVDSPAWDPTSGLYGLHATPDNETSYRMLFSAPTFAVGMSICDSEETDSSEIIEVFDPSGYLIGSSPVPYGTWGSNANFFVGFTSTVPIGSIDVHVADSSGEAVLLDDIIVPEPGTVGLLGAGLVALVARRRRSAEKTRI